MRETPAPAQKDRAANSAMQVLSVERCPRRGPRAALVRAVSGKVSAGRCDSLRVCDSQTAVRADCDSVAQSLWTSCVDSGRACIYLLLLLAMHYSAMAAEAASVVARLRALIPEDETDAEVVERLSSVLTASYRYQPQRLQF